MQNGSMTILNNSEIKRIENLIKKNYGCDFHLREYAVMIGPEEKIWGANRDIRNIDFEKLDVNSIGMNFGKLKSDKVHLTIEGSQLVGKEATKNVVELNDEDMKKFVSGSTIEISPINCEMNNFVILKSGRNILGSSLLTENGLKNLLPKSRRIQ